MTKLSRTHPIIATLPYETPIYTAREIAANQSARQWADLVMWRLPHVLTATLPYHAARRAAILSIGETARQS